MSSRRGPPRSLCGRRGNAGELPGQRHARARIVGAREPLLVGGETTRVVHLEEELARGEGVARVLPGQLEQAKALQRRLIAGDKKAVQVRADVGVVQIGLARSHEETRAAELPDV